MNDKVKKEVGMLRKMINKRYKSEPLGELWNTSWDDMNKLKLAKINEAYHRKQMEYHQEQIKILTSREIDNLTSNKKGGELR